MLIVSDFHDYYDTCTSYGVDKTVVYNRTTQLLTHKLDLRVPPTETTKGVLEIQKFIIGFCGKLFPIVSIYRWATHTHSCFYTADECLNLAGFRKQYKSKIMRSWYGSFSLSDKAEVGKFFDPHTWHSLLPIFQLYKVPVFFVGNIFEQHGKNLMLNPKLATFSFAKVKDPQSAFQDIYMYISGVLGVDERPMIVVSDKDKAAAKGHDDFYSFKRPPGGGRWR